MTRRNAIAEIDRAGALLVFPLDNRPEPRSLWSSFYSDEMRWEWDDNGDDRVARLWQLRGDLSTTRKVVYTKWYRGRATYFSRALFANLLRALNPRGDGEGAEARGLSREARRILETLEGESPLSTKELKRIADLQGKANERAYERAMKELWSRLLVVAFGEVDDGAFPSLAVGSTRVLYEDLWKEAFALSPVAARAGIGCILPAGNPFFRFYRKLAEDAGDEADGGSGAEGAGGESTPSRPAARARKAIASELSFEDLVRKKRR